MSESRIKLYYKNVTADVIGSEHGIAEKQLKDLVKKTEPLISRLNKERQNRQTPYRDLPFRTEI
ncbi:MAG: hypothetical protein ACETVZ_04605, partial [Phycisphaerae bacterium]